MGTSVQVTPLCGVYNENPLSYLVSIDGFNFLVDCGWNDHFDTSLLQPLSRYSTNKHSINFIFQFTSMYILLLLLGAKQVFYSVNSFAGLCI